MKEKLKSSSKTLYGVCACIIILMLACYFGNNSIKGTYSSSDVTSVTCDGTIYSSSKLWLSAGNYYCCPSGTSEMTTGSCWYYQKCAKDECDNINPTGATWSCKNVFVSLIDGYRRECSTRAVAALTKTATACSEVVSSSPCGKSQVITTNSSFSCVGYVYKKVDYDKNASCSENGGSHTLYKFEKTGCASGYTENAAGVCVKNSSESEVGCYIANNRYQWSTVDLGSPWKKVDIPKANCSGCAAGYVENADGDCIKKQISSITITFMNGSTKVKTESCTVPSGSQSCTNSIVAPGPQTSSDSNKVFNGWGEKDGCTSGSYTANAALRPTVSRVYYACYRDASGDGKPSADFSASKCTYSSLYTVTRDTRYLNCKYTNITYNNSATEDTVGNVSACCSAKGYMWVSENFTSSGYGNEYCLVCEGSSGGNTPSNPSTPSSSTPSSSTPSSSSNVDENPKTGSVAIFLVWIIALGTLVYAGVYFKQVRENN